ncbi:EthD family reductase [Paenibacillus sp. SI8]|uniref:EthD family reductase n=1 Tax=unclassified Paenibacillus TaxID=185978 RepID=UPI0034675801
MYKMMAIYEEPKDIEKFDEHYFGVHVPLLHKLPHLLSFSVQRVKSVQNTETPIYLVVELKYENETTFNQSFVSKEGREAQADTTKMLPLLYKLPTVLLVEEVL